LKGFRVISREVERFGFSRVFEVRVFEGFGRMVSGARGQNKDGQ
jgi:hypothetical protein